MFLAGYSGLGSTTRSAIQSIYRQTRPRSEWSLVPRLCAECTSQRTFSRTARQATAAPRRDDGSSSQKKPLRLYRYFGRHPENLHCTICFLSNTKSPRSCAVDVHGQLFLHDTVPKNLTSCFKNAEFLDFFFTRLRPNESPSASEEEVSQLEEDWTDAKAGKLREEEACRLARGQGYQWISPCMGELNFIKAEDTPIVYKDLTEDGESASLAQTLCPKSDLNPHRGAQLGRQPYRAFRSNGAVRPP